MEDAECVGGQLCGDKEYPFSGVIKSGRFWRKVPKSNAWSVGQLILDCVIFHFFPLSSSVQSEVSNGWIPTTSSQHS